MLKIERIKICSLSFYELALIEFPQINEYLTKNDYEVVYRKPYTYIIKDGKMWFSKCMDCDIFTEEAGLFIAFYKMKKWDLPKFYKKCKVSELKSGDKFKLFTNAKIFYTYDTKSKFYNNTIYCISNKNNLPEPFDGNTLVFKIY